MRYKNLLFDLDGTIIDSQDGIFNSLIYALDSFGIAVQDRDALRRYIGPPLMDTFRNGYGFSEEKAAVATAKYRERYSEIGVYECRAYDGICALLTDLSAAGYRLILATSKPLVFAEKILEKLGVSGAFAFLSGSTLDGGRDSKEEVIQYALTTLRITEPASCLMIGDRFYDVVAATALGMECAGVLYGFGTRAELESAGAAYVLETVAAMRAFLLP